ncbi:carboxypeptidase regulatory-like domain-containing protein [bacterium]|nr:carboxypeptidase regulatory-like domain-containing protein [bacterium]MCI0606493.1 carboxypeptidase regulatory-like domain-containing protein [bacterium]
MKHKVFHLMLLFAAFSVFSIHAEETKYRETKLLFKGWVKGRVIHTNPGLEVPKLEVNRDSSSCGVEPRKIQAVEIAPNGGLQNAVVFLKEISAGKDFVLSADPPVLHQTHCDYQPHVQLVPPMSSIKITNDDKLLHSVHAFWFPFGTKFVIYPNSVTYPAKTLFNIAMVAQRKESFQQLGASGIVKFICEAGHYWMTAYVIVTPHPYFAKVDSQGNYTLEDVPPGKYILVSWHEYFGTKEQPITVKENQPAEANFAYSDEL